MGAARRAVSLSLRRLKLCDIAFWVRLPTRRAASALPFRAPGLSASTPISCCGRGATARSAGEGPAKSAIIPESVLRPFDRALSTIHQDDDGFGAPNRASGTHRGGKTGGINGYPQDQPDRGFPHERTGSPEVQVAILSERITTERALQRQREGRSLATRPAQAGRAAPAPAGLREGEEHGTLRAAHQASRHPQEAHTEGTGAGSRPFAFSGAAYTGARPWQAAVPLCGPTRADRHRTPPGQYRSPGASACREPHAVHAAPSWELSFFLFETGKLAKQADGSVLVRMGDTVVLVTACHAASPRVGIDFLPSTGGLPRVHLRVGRIPGGFKREGKPTEKEVSTSRLIDGRSAGFSSPAGRSRRR